MAAEPKRSLRRTVAGTVEERSPRFLLGSLALAMVISLLAGLVIGIQIGENDEPTKAKPAAATKPKTSTTKRPTAQGRNRPLVGTVVRTGPKVLVISRQQRPVSFVLVKNSVVDLTTTASPKEIKVGSHVLFAVKPAAAAPSTTAGSAPSTTAKAAGGPTATEIVIVTGTLRGRPGSVVSAVTPDSMTFKARNGGTVKVSTVGAKVLKTIPGTRADLTANRPVLVQSYIAPPAKKPKKAGNAAAAPRRRIAVEIVVLPLATAFR